MKFKMIWTLWYVDQKGRKHFRGAFPTREETRGHQREGLGHLKHPPQRYIIRAIDPRKCGPA